MIREAENLLERSELPKLGDFYRALVDAYPGPCHRKDCSINVLFGVGPVVFSRFCGSSLYCLRGFHVPLAKLLTQNLRAAGISGPNPQLRERVEYGFLALLRSSFE